MRERIHAWLEGLLGLELPVWLVPDQVALVALGFLLSAIAAVWLAHRDRLPLRNVALGLLACFVGAVVGSRLFANVLRVELWLEAPWRVLDLRRSGATSVGALLGGCVGFWLYSRRGRLDLWRTADAVAPAAGLGLGLARLGCFVHGCDFGRVTALAWGVRYPSGTLPFEAQQEHGFVGPYQALSLPVQPFALVLAGLDLAIFALFALRPALGRGQRPGERAMLAAALYFGLRFVVEFLRSPWTSPMLGLLSLAQWACLLALVALAALVRARRRSSAVVDAAARTG